MDMIDSLGFSYTNRLAPVALMLRTGEAIDAVENFVASGRNATPTEAGGFVLCGLMQLGGLLYWAVIIPLLAIVLLCLPICTACGVFCYNTMCCCIRMRALEAGGSADNRQGGEQGTSGGVGAPAGLFPGAQTTLFAHARLPETAPPASPPSPTQNDIEQELRLKRARDTRLHSLLVQRHEPRSAGVNKDAVRRGEASSSSCASAPSDTTSLESESLLQHDQEDN